MPSDASYGVFIRLLQEKYNRLRGAVDDLFYQLTAEDRTRKLDAVKRVQTMLAEFRATLAQRDVPVWLQDLDHSINVYLSGHTHDNAAATLLRSLTRLLPAINSVDELPNESGGARPAVDFVAVYADLFQRSHIPALFDELIKQIEAIATSGEIDSIKVVRRLESLIATIRKNVRADYFSTKATWEFTSLFIQNLGLEVLESVPVLKQTVKALRKTMDELNIEMHQVYGAFKVKVIELVQDDLPALDYHATKLLPPPKHEELPPKG